MFEHDSFILSSTFKNDVSLAELKYYVPHCGEEFRTVGIRPDDMWVPEKIGTIVLDHG